MSKFNTADKKPPVVNHVGHKAYKNSPKIELINAVIATFIEDSYYEKKESRIKRISKLIGKVAKNDPEFVAKLAIYVRKEAHMRSSFHVIVGELAKVHRGDDLIARTMVKGSERPDDITEIIGYLGRPLPNQIKKGAAKVFSMFDEYQLAKHRGDNGKFSLTDSIRLSHPHPAEGREDLYKSIAEGSLRNTNTWETRSSKGEAKSEVFKDLLKNKKMPYMALLKNLRNIILTGDSETISLAARYLSNEKAVLGSKQLPFRFLAAYEALKGLGSIENIHSAGKLVFEKDTSNANEILEALNVALTYSVKNIPILSGRTLILSDNSGSMKGDRGGSSAISAHSSLSTSNIANLFSVLYWLRADNTAIGLFGDRIVHPKLDRDKNIFENYDIITNEASRCGVGTEQGIFSEFESLISAKQKVDRIVIFSDMQIGRGATSYDGWYGSGLERRPGTFNSLYQKYMSMFPDTYVYSVDLKGYGTTVFDGRVLSLSGWSNKIFDTMLLMETDKDAFIKSIESIDL